jgi:(E)-4-hydroxy-3-methylbut-2-enyl-diphosphate synthase
MLERKLTRPVMVGDVQIGGGAQVSVQSMVKCDTLNVAEVIREIDSFEAAGCDIVRVAAPTLAAAECFKEIRKHCRIPLVADVHFDYRIALKVLEAGIDKLRINPGNIGARWKVEEVTRACQERGTPIRIGVNAGSLEEEFLEKYGYPTPSGMVDSALKHVGILEDLGFDNTVISIKASDVRKMIEAYQLLSSKVDYPLHVGVTEAGTTLAGTIKSSVGIGTVLAAGIGDTIRVSLSADGAEEIRVGYEILKSLGLRTRGINIISCPSCGRVQIDLVRVANQVEERLSHIDVPLNVAVMGCVVNGPGEAAEADVALFGGKGVGMLYIGGDQVRRTSEAEMVDSLVELVEQKALEYKEKGLQKGYGRHG